MEGFSALAAMELRRQRNRLRRLLHRPAWLLFYGALGAGLLFLMLGMPAQPASPPEGTGSGGSVPGGLAALWILVSVATRLWGATTRSPFVLASADTALLLPSPISSRQIVLFQLLRAAVQRLITQLLFLILWVVVLDGFGLPLGRAGVWSFYGFVMLMGLWGDGLHASAWLALEQVSPSRAATVRRSIRGLLLVAGASLALWLAYPLGAALLGGRGGGGGYGAARAMLERAYLLAEVPPLNWAAELFRAALGQGTPALLALLGGAGVIAGLWVLAVALGANYYEALVLQGEQDARLQQATASWNVDVQSAAVQMGLARKIRRVPALPGGHGAWALFWQQANRWLRLELGSWWIGLVALGGVGALAGGAVRAGLPHYWLYLTPAALALVSAPWGYLAEELRRPYIYLIPDPAWKRLIAASLVSSGDIFVSYGLMLVAAVLVARAGPATLGTGLLLLLAAVWVAQGALALAGVAVPPWLGRGTRTAIQSFLSLMGLLPGAGAAWAAWQAGAGPIFMAAAVLLVTATAGAGLFVLAAALFHKAEMPE